MSRIEDKVMASVLLIHTGRKFISATAFKGYAVVAALVSTMFLVSLPNVLTNLTQVGMQGLITFFSSAITQTEVSVQVFLAIALVGSFLFARDLARGTVAPRFA